MPWSPGIQEIQNPGGNVVLEGIDWVDHLVYAT